MLKEKLKDKIPKEILDKIPRSFDIIGNKEKAVAIIDWNEIYDRYKNEIAKAIMELNKNVKSVLFKKTPRKGNLRLYEFEIIGDKNTEVIHKEYGYFLKLDPTKVYFSPRESTERQRIASKVRENEKILYLFSGIAPFAFAIFKKIKDVRIYCIEINKYAIKYAEENKKINKVENRLFNILCDVRYLNLKEKFDRILVTLPISTENFLIKALEFAKENTVIHYYNWGKEDNLFEKALNDIEEATKLLNFNYEILEKIKVLPYAPKIYKVRIDFRVF
ncbi:MAG: class I SAM-dependent methyltransferase family protein [Candidatus Aenigmarchaeota archaeon]|nr:class I SAM-dependent methyltransferase family protein [Candidatus Aenigmarchaeota archaeon]